MKPTTRTIAGALLILTASLSGCDALLNTDDNRARQARVSVTGASTAQLRLITSDRFAVLQYPGGQRDVSLVLADTVFFAPPFDSTFEIGPSGRFFVRLTNEAPDDGADIELLIRLDGESVYDRSLILGNEEIEYMYLRL